MYYKSASMFVFLSLLSLNEALRILVYFPMSSKSHSILGHGFVDNLLAAGHEVVHVTAHPKDKPVPNLKEYNLFPSVEKFNEKYKDQMEEFNLGNLIGKPSFVSSIFFPFMIYNLQSNALHEDIVYNLLADPEEKFDAVILEWFFHNSIAGIAPLFQCPLIWFGSTEAHWEVLRVVDEATNPSYTTNIFSETSPPLSFVERVEQLWQMVKTMVVVDGILAHLEKYLYNNHLGKLATQRGVTLPPYNEAIYNASFLFLNSHPSYGTPYRLPQNAKYIGGYHIDTKVKPLPKDLQKLMDEAKHGVIYFSMGSYLKSADLKDEMKRSLLNVLGKLKETVIWKFEEDFENVPSNVHFVKWAPQQSILAHPNLKTFITHGGQLSTTESVHYGVPVIGAPVMGDQFTNMKSIAKKGFGILVPLTENLAEDLAVALREMLTNPSYKKKAKELSAIYHDRIMTPGKELVHWVEHVVRTKGAPHLRSPGLDVPFYQKIYLDLVVLILLVVASLVAVKRFIFKKLCIGEYKIKTN